MRTSDFLLAAHARRRLSSGEFARAAGRNALSRKTVSEIAIRRLNGLDNSFQYRDHFDALHTKSSETI
ncbi:MULTISPECIES: hypothetical protein [Burkholderia]|uniref:hypothetical protein n=1 Tax=Burkholderia TaxID=32008 RepID=UPI000A6EE38F|nr:MULTISPECIES: hypothetical protein [Burkholderia]